MHFKWLHDYWVSVFVLASIATASLWLAANGKLDLYIHPRYIVFTTILCGMAILCLLGNAFTQTKAPKLTETKKIPQAIATLLCTTLCIVMLVARPGGLTSSAANQRTVNSGALTLSTNSSVNDLTDSHTAFEQFTIKEWASLLVQTNDTELFKDKPAHITGFISPAPDGNTNTFYLSRFVITCCAVDARPIGVPIYLPGWQKSYKADQWLEIHGAFTSNPEGTTIPNVLSPKSINQISEPADPYVY